LKRKADVERGDCKSAEFVLKRRLLCGNTGIETMSDLVKKDVIGEDQGN